MKVKELIKRLEKMDIEKDIVIRFAVSNKDEIGYVLEPTIVDKYVDEVAIYCDYPTNKNGDYEVIGQYDLQKLWEDECNKYLKESEK